MRKVDLRRTRNLWVVIALWALHHPALIFAEPLNFNGSWHYLQAGGDVEDFWSFREAYSAILTKDLSAGMDFSGNFRYNQDTRSEGDDSQQLAPSAAFDLRNDLFAFNLNASETQTSSSNNPTYTNQSWNANWFSGLDQKWPGLRLNVGQTYSTDDATPAMRDSESSYFGASTDYSWSIFKLLYNFRANENVDNLTETTSTNTRHYGQIQFSDDFWQKRLTVSGAQYFTVVDSETEFHLTVGQDFFSTLILTDAYSGLDDTPLFGALAPNAALIDGDREASSGVEIAQIVDPQNLAVRIDFQDVDHIRVYLDREINAATQGLLEWDVYTSNDGTIWELIDQIPQITYDEEFARTVVQIDIASTLSARYVKAVVEPVAPAIEQVFVTEVEAGRIQTATSDRQTQSSNNRMQQSQLNFGYRPNSKMAFAYNLAYSTSDPDPGLSSTQFNHALSGNYAKSRYLNVSFNVSENRDDAEDTEEAINRSYALSLRSEPLDTLDLSVGYTHSDSYWGGDQDTLSDTLTGYASARIFSDLTASLTTNWVQTSNEETGMENTTFGWRVNTSARFNPKLYGDVFYEYAQSEGEGDPQTTEETSSMFNRYGVGATYRPSDILLMHGALSRDQDENSTNFSGNVSWKATRNIQAHVACYMDIENLDSQNYSASMNWTISRHFSFRTSFGYVLSESVDSWNWLTSVNVSF